MPELRNATRPRPELVSPAGSFDAGCAALQYGADAVYAGLEKFSARADAENLSLDQLDRLVAYARSLTPARRVYVTVNTLVLQRELGELVETLGALQELGVDAVICQDLGVQRIVRRHFPSLALHASTQMAIHNRAGVETLARMGFSRVVLARELTLDEIRDCASVGGIEIECFVHGALCYSYSGLCLFSSHALGRSGNRGRCAQVCRTAFASDRQAGCAAGGGLLFSMKDLALGERLDALVSSGVSALKIEGRKRTPLWVAAATDYYRRLLDGTLAPAERASLEEDLKTIFSRPWTRLYIDSREETGVTDPSAAGHRGAPAGTVEAIVCRVGAGGAHLRVRTTRRLERYDGLQVDLPGLYKPFGFPVERLRLVPASRRGRPREVYEAPAGSVVEIALPKEYPQIPPGTVVYCSSSQEVKRRYRIERPRPGAFRVTRPVDFTVEISRENIVATAEASVGGETLRARGSLEGPFQPARDAGATEAAIRSAFGKLGGTSFRQGKLEIANPLALFAPVSRLNALRRELVSELESGMAAARSARLECAKRDVLGAEAPRACEGGARLRWSVKVARASALSGFGQEDWREVEEAVVAISGEAPEALAEALEGLAGALGRERIRLALPPVARSWEERELASKIESLAARGWTRWEAANLSAWTRLARVGAGDFDISADWPLYAVNRQAALALLELGASRFTLSPEDGIENMRRILAEFGDSATVIVRQDTPLFISETCPFAADCRGESACWAGGARLVSSYGERVVLAVRRCRTVVLDERPFSLAGRLGELAEAGARVVRADFSWREHDPARLREIWRGLRAGLPVERGHEANYSRGMA